MENIYRIILIIQLSTTFYFYVLCEFFLQNEVSKIAHPCASLLLFGLDVPSLPRNRHMINEQLKFIELDFLGSEASQATCQQLLDGHRASPEIVTTLLSLCLLDLPFLILRITLMVAYGFYTSSGLFFILKNVMMCFLQVGSNF